MQKYIYQVKLGSDDPDLKGQSIYRNGGTYHRPLIQHLNLSWLILVTSGRVYRDFKGKGWLKMIYQWRPQNIVIMVSVK